jgi:acyl-coenzyme A synthetase/AMP-(fatty) acid ligase
VARVERFNFTRDVLDRSTGRALVFTSPSGEVREPSFEEVSARAAQWANLLRRRGVEQGDRVLVLLGKTPEWSAAMCGCLKAGAIAIPCSEMLRAKDLDFRVRHSGAKLLVADPSARGELDRLEAEVEVLTLDEARLEEEPDRAEAASAPALRPRAEP